MRVRPCWRVGRPPAATTTAGGAVKLADKGSE